jgi:hypothetical protein
MDERVVFHASRGSFSITSMAARAITVPGPKIAAAPAADVEHGDVENAQRTMTQDVEIPR